MQYRYVNYRKKLTSLEQNRFLANIAQPGIICGFDAIESILNNTITLNHSLTGSTTTAGDNTTTRKVGASKSRHGVIVMEDNNISFTVDYNDGNANIREDILVMNHNWLDSDPGATATYAIIKGSTSSQETPTVSNDKTQVVLGKFIIPAGAVDHTNTIWIRNKPNIGGLVPLLKDNLGNALSWPTTSFFNDFNKMNETGIFYISGTPSNKPVVDKNNYLVIVMTSGSNITQLAIVPTTGKVYGRGFSSTWSPWVNLNNPDIDVAVTELENAIGDRTYTQQNYITNDETITNSLDVLDIAVDANATDIQNLLTTTNNLATNKADKSTLINAGAGLTGGGDLSADRTLSIANGGVTDAMIQVRKVDAIAPSLLAMAVVNLPTWNMDTTDFIQVAHGMTGSMIRGVQVVIRSDAGNSWSGELVGSSDVQLLVSWDDTNVTIFRTSAGFYDAAAYSSTAFSRGWLLITRTY